MFGNVNKVTLLGRLGADPELRTMQNGKKVATLSVATSEFWTDQHTNEYRERVEWHRVVVFNERFVPVIEKVGAKGARVLLEGSNQTRKWKDKDGVERYTTEIVIQNFRGDFQVIPDGKKDSKPAETGDQGLPPDVDDEIPF